MFLVFDYHRNIIFIKTLSFIKINIKKGKFYFSQEPMDINDVNIELISLSDKHFIGKSWYQYFVDYINYVGEIVSFLIKLPK